MYRIFAGQFESIQRVLHKDLEDRCWKVIEKQTEEAVTSDEFVTLEGSVVKSVVKRENCGAA